MSFVFVMLGTAVFIAAVFFYGKATGSDAAKGNQAKDVAKSLKAQDQAAAKVVKGKDGLIDDLRKAGF